MTQYLSISQQYAVTRYNYFLLNARITGVEATQTYRSVPHHGAKNRVTRKPGIKRMLARWKYP